MIAPAHRDLADAAALSLEIVQAAEQRDVERLAELDARRMQSLESFRLAGGRPAAADLSLLEEIAGLNERALSLFEQQRGMTSRTMDRAALGRRAVSAYANNRASR